LSDSPILACEPFTTYQGTGALAGRRQFFVRFAGCDAPCPIRKVCDEQAALNFDGVVYDPSLLADAALSEVGPNGWIHITGGEPCSQPDALRSLAAEATKRRLRIHLQSSGMKRVPIAWDWLTVSPKGPAHTLTQRSGSECVLVYDPSWVIDCGIAMGIRLFTKFQHYYIQPLWDGGESNLAEAMAFCGRLNTQEEWHLTDQFHKHWGIR
jgi:organic radical activating enzyme